MPHKPTSVRAPTFHSASRRTMAQPRVGVARGEIPIRFIGRGLVKETVLLIQRWRIYLSVRRDTRWQGVLSHGRWALLLSDEFLLCTGLLNGISCISSLFVCHNVIRESYPMPCFIWRDILDHVCSALDGPKKLYTGFLSRYCKLVF